MQRRSVLTGTRCVTALRRQGRARNMPLGMFLLACCLAATNAVALRQAVAQTPALPAPIERQPSQPPAPASAASANEPPDTVDLDEVLNRPGDLNLHGVSLNDALFMIGEQWKVNIVAGDLQGTVKGEFRHARLREILDSILLSNKYNYRPVGKTLVVSSISDFGYANPSLDSATIPVLTADIDEVVEGARLLVTPQGKVQALKSARSIVVLDFPDRVQMVREFVKSLDDNGNRRFAAPGSQSGMPLEVGYFHTQYITAKSAEQALSAVLSKSGRVGVMDREDRLLVSDYAENLAMIEKVLTQIDRPRPQVRITALIYDISLQDIQQIGLNWNAVGKSRINAGGDPQSSLGIDSIMQVPFEAGATGSTLTFMNLARHLDITAVALLLAQANDARLIGNPNVAVLENEEAIFQSVSEIPYQQLTQTQQGGQIGTTAFKEAGITLRVRPKIAADRTIEMLVTPEFSRLTGFTPGDNQPIIDKRTATSMVRVCDRQTVVIGGLRQRSDVGDFKGVPYLKDIPGVGRVFRSRDTDVRESELVVFIMPEIMNYGDPLSSRDQLVADTSNCRLAQIPLPEGCPPACVRLPCDGAAASPTIVVPGVEELSQPAAAAPPIVVPPEPIQQTGSAHEGPQMTEAQVRRLPAVTPAAGALGAVAERTAPPPRMGSSAAPASAGQESRRPVSANGARW